MLLQADIGGVDQSTRPSPVVPYSLFVVPLPVIVVLHHAVEPSAALLADLLDLLDVLKFCMESKQDIVSYDVC